MTSRKLHYVADPMCSWCWGFHSELEMIRAELPADLEIEFVMGGLAVDSEEPMPAEIRDYVQQAWREVQSHTGAEFNWEFWEKCEPRRSTYPSCRAVIAAGLAGSQSERAMFEALQRAYYLEARNPSLEETLVEVAGEIGLDSVKFAEDLRSTRVEELFREHRARRRSLGANSFPSLMLEEADGDVRCVMRGSGTANEVLDAIR